MAGVSLSDPVVRARLLARVAGGEPLARITREAGMPRHSTVCRQANRDPGFRAELLAAQLAGRPARPAAGFDPEVARAMLARLWAGETMHGVLKDPAMPNRKILRQWREADPGFAEELQRYRLARRDEGEARMRRLTSRPFDPAAADRIFARLWQGERLRDVLKSDPAFPGKNVLRRWRRENREFDARMAGMFAAWRARGRLGRTILTPRLEATICEALVGGESLASLGRRADMPCAGTLYAWVRDRPDFARKVAAACEARAWGYIDRMAQVADAAGADPVAQMRAKRAIARLNRRLGRLSQVPGERRP